MAPLTIKHANKSFGTVSVLQDVDVDIKDGEFVVLVGPSGCGKSTLLRLIAGLEDLSSGDILIDGKVVTTLHPKDRDIAMVFQSYALYPHMTVAENMGFSLRMQKIPPADRDRKVRAAAEILGLVQLLQRYPKQLSGGQRQRVAMGRAIVRDPKVFLFDEPLSNLDAQLRVQMRAEIRQLHKQLKATIVYVTHDQIEAMTMADKIVVMRGGRIEQAGSPLALYDTPANTFVARFIGSPSMNILRGRIGSEGDSFISSKGMAFQFSRPLPRAAGRDVFFGMRPGDLARAQTGLDASVQMIEPTGAELLVTLAVGDETITAVFHGRPDIQEGANIKIALEQSKVHLFDGDTGIRLTDFDLRNPIPGEDAR